MLTWGVLSHFLPVAWIVPTNILLACLAIAAGIPAATRVARASQTKDPQFVVIDETAGQLITLIGAPLSWKSFLVGFILFRAFDIVKPPPVRQLERLPEGVGIVVDDVAAGLYGLAVMQLLLYLGLLGR
jgi:phosphatidylglycerophosphatase A